MPTVAMECDGCNREFEIVEVSCSFVDEDMKDAVECPYCTKAVMGAQAKYTSVIQSQLKLYALLRSS